LSALAKSEDELPEAPSASVLTARPVDHEGGSETGTQVSVEDAIKRPVPSSVKLLRGEFLNAPSFDPPLTFWSYRVIQAP